MDSSKMTALVIGAGNIATRRVKTLLNFKFNVRIVSRHISVDMATLITGKDSHKKIEIIERTFEPNDITNCDIVLACTNDRRVNEIIGIAAKKANIPVSVCDSAEESDFWFPAIALSETMNVGIVGEGGNHRLTRENASKIRTFISEVLDDEK